MKYYINGKPATEAEAAAQIELNDRIMKIEDPEIWLKEMQKAAFITVIGERKTNK